MKRRASGGQIDAPSSQTEEPDDHRPYCGNNDPYTLIFMASEDQPEFQIDFCTKCNHYIKIIDEEKLKKTIPKGFEDILTLNLDLAAKDASLIRD